MKLPLDQRELATVLAALRYWQKMEAYRPLELEAIATDSESFAPLNGDEIDRLCERINIE